MKYLFICISAVLMFFQCKEEGPTTPSYDPANGYLEVVVPTGGETYSVEDTITLQFKINADKIHVYVPAVSIDGGATWNVIPTISPTTSGVGGQLFSYNWIIGNENEYVAYDAMNSQCKIKVYDYADIQKMHISGLFTVVR